MISTTHMSDMSAVTYVTAYCVCLCDQITPGMECLHVFILSTVSSPYTVYYACYKECVSGVCLCWK